MTEHRTAAAWMHTSSVMALIAEINRNPKKQSRKFKPSDFNPTVKREKKQRAGDEHIEVKDFNELRQYVKGWAEGA